MASLKSEQRTGNREIGDSGRLTLVVTLFAVWVWCITYIFHQGSILSLPWSNLNMEMKIRYRYDRFRQVLLLLLLTSDRCNAFLGTCHYLSPAGGGQRISRGPHGFRGTGGGVNRCHQSLEGNWIKPTANEGEVGWRWELQYFRTVTSSMFWLWRLY